MVLVKDLKFLKSAGHFDNGEEHRQVSACILDLFNSKVAGRLGKAELKPGDAFILKNVMFQNARPMSNGFFDFDIGWGQYHLGFHNTTISVFLGMTYRSTDKDGYYSFFELLWLHEGRFYFYERPVKIIQAQHKIKKENFVFWNLEDFVTNSKNHPLKIWENIS